MRLSRSSGAVLQRGCSRRRWLPTRVCRTTRPGSSPVTRPIRRASAPAGRACSAPSACSASAPGTIARNRPSQATYRGSKPSSSHAPWTSRAPGLRFLDHGSRRRDATAISQRAVARPPRVGSRRHVRARHRRPAARGHQVDTGALSDRSSLELESLASRHHRDPVIAHRPRHQHGVARPGPARADRVSLPYPADAGRVDEDAVALSLVHDLRVAGHDRRAHRGAGPPPSRPTTRWRSAIGSPSSSTKPALRKSGSRRTWRGRSRSRAPPATRCRRPGRRLA